MTRYYWPGVRMRGLVIGFIAAAVAATLALIAALALHAVTTVAIRWYLLALGVFAIIALYRVIAGSYPVHGRSAIDSALENEPIVPDRPERLQDLERQVYLAHVDASEFHYRLAPLLRELVSYRLASHRSVPSEGIPAAARTLLGADIYDLLWPGKDKPVDRRGPGIDVRRLQAIVRAVEEL